MEVTLKHLANRIKLDGKLLEKHPEQAEMLNERIKRHKEDIVKCVIANIDNPYLENITER